MLLLAVLYRATPVTPSVSLAGGEEFAEFVGSQWLLLKMVGHQLRNRIGEARQEEIENILEYNRYLIITITLADYLISEECLPTS